MGLDSIELVMEIEKYFGIQIPDAEAEKIYTVQSMVDTVAVHLNVSSNSFALRDSIFQRVKNNLPFSVTVKAVIQLTDYVVNYLPLNDNTGWVSFATSLGLDVPKPEYVDSNSNKFSDRLKRLFAGNPNYEPANISFETFVTAICASNYKELLQKNNISTLYEIYVAIIAITVDKIGVDYYEIAPGKSFTNDLGVD